MDGNVKTSYTGVLGADNSGSTQRKNLLGE